MYDWKDIALMYKKELADLHNDIENCCFILEEGNPHCVARAIKVAEHSIECSEVEVKFIESFEEKILESNPKPEPKPEPKKVKSGKRINFTYELTKEDNAKIDNWCSKDAKKRIFDFVDKGAMYVVDKWIKNHQCSTNLQEAVRNNDNILIVRDEKSFRTRTVKVLTSGMKFKGRTRPFQTEEEMREVPVQHTYLVDPKESVSDMYIFVNYEHKERKFTIYARIQGNFIKSMYFEPIRDRYIGKMACLLQKGGYNKDVGESLSVDAMLM